MRDLEVASSFLASPPRVPWSHADHSCGSGENRVQ